MDIPSIQNSPVGELVAITGTEPRTGDPYSHFAFVPDPLSNDLRLSMETIQALEEASRAIGALGQACLALPNPQLLIQPALYSEATATSALEGTYGELNKVMESRLPGAGPGTPEIREINAYIDMAHYGFEWVREGRGITQNFIFDLQKILAQGSARPPAEPGQLRSGQVVIGPQGCLVRDARFVPPPALSLRDGFAELVDWVQGNSQISPLLKIALTHYQFETLHPFNDCNGRVGRLLIILEMLQHKLISTPYLTISPWFLRRRDQYQDRLLNVSQTGDWNTWIGFFCEAVRDQSRAHVRVASELIDWQADLSRKLFERKWSGVIGQVVERLIEWPILTNKTVQDQFGVSSPTAKSVTDRLLEIGALDQISDSNYGRVFGATEVMKLVESL